MYVILHVTFIFGEFLRRIIRCAEERRRFIRYSTTQLIHGPIGNTSIEFISQKHTFKIDLPGYTTFRGRNSFSR